MEDWNEAVNRNICVESSQCHAHTNITSHTHAPNRGTPTSRIIINIIAVVSIRKLKYFNIVQISYGAIRSYYMPVMFVRVCAAGHSLDSIDTQSRATHFIIVF